MDSLVEVVIPWWDSGCPHRARHLATVQAFFGSAFPVVVGSGPKSRAAARNAAVRMARADVVAVVDADILIPHRQINMAGRESIEHGRLATPFDHLWYLTQEQTNLALQSDDPFRAATLGQPSPLMLGGAFVLPRDLWWDVGGMDENFDGWGGEDNAFIRSCEQALGSRKVVTGPALHLWHPAARQMSAANRARLSDATQHREDKYSHTGLRPCGHP